MEVGNKNEWLFRLPRLKESLGPNKVYNEIQQSHIELVWCLLMSLQRHTTVFFPRVLLLLRLKESELFN